MLGLYILRVVILQYSANSQQQQPRPAAKKASAARRRRMELQEMGCYVECEKPGCYVECEKESCFCFFHLASPSGAEARTRGQHRVAAAVTASKSSSPVARSAPPGPVPGPRLRRLRGKGPQSRLLGNGQQQPGANRYPTAKWAASVSLPSAKMKKMQQHSARSA